MTEQIGPTQTDSELIRGALREVIGDSDAPASARVQAARTLAEIVGELGRQADAPANPNRSSGDMTLDEIDAELDAI
jgi:hypothetical protein